MKVRLKGEGEVKQSSSQAGQAGQAVRVWAACRVGARERRGLEGLAVSAPWTQWPSTYRMVQYVACTRAEALDACPVSTVSTSTVLFLTS